MTFVEALGGQNGQTIVEAMGGSKGDRFEDVMSKKEITVSDNPLAAIAMDFDIADSVDLLGKKASDLQTDMAVDGHCKVTGTSKYVTGYTGFSGDPAEQEGNYIAFHISVGDLVIGTNVTVKANGVTMDPDGLHVVRFKDGVKGGLVYVQAIADGHSSVTKIFDFSSVVKESAENNDEEPEEEEVVKYTVTYDSNGGTGSIDPVEVVAGESIIVDDGSGLTPPEDMLFAGWAKTSSAQNPTVTYSFTPDKDTTLYAVWSGITQQEPEM